MLFFLFFSDNVLKDQVFCQNSYVIDAKKWKLVYGNVLQIAYH